ncbi:hypothetical protein [Microcoleus sp. PH2017_22_RUC_O_B]|uniref:hypothetical protein n=1 Tax=Microcoleus sp. PH2017_22_RUC_O_B TaxID=2798833 RepID=UPI00260117E2|nr:hypothetical protein [Microcoleus sp. PH2017_22_RUC_O_B]
MVIAQTNPPNLASDATQTRFTGRSRKPPKNVTNIVTERLLLCPEVQKSTARSPVTC